ncbi:DUF559 domain-containing protein [Tsukamurella soli]|uniref:DUF559 domain-containing protein n=1 Tax=Tsukamurella soli TaxID=644556 RepID=UPI0031EF1CCF
MARHLADHDGIITRREALALGLSTSAVDRRVRAKLWHQLGSGMYLATTHPLTEAARLRAATKIAGGAADSLSAAWWHGLADDLPDVVTVTVPPGRKPRTRGAIRFEVTRRRLPAEDVDLLRGVAVTRAPFSILEAATAAGGPLMDRALQTGAVTLTTLEKALARNAGRPGLAEARRLVAVAAGDAESEAERHFARLLRLHRIGGWVQQMPFGIHRLDFAFPVQLLAVEIDGWAFHRTPDRAAADAQKQNRLTIAGWRPLRFTWHQLDSAPEDVIDQVVAALSV